MLCSCSLSTAQEYEHGLSASINETLRQACTKAKEGRTSSSTENVEKLRWNKDLDSVTLKPEEKSAMKPDPFLREIRSLEPKEARCHLLVSVRPFAGANQ